MARHELFPHQFELSNALLNALRIPNSVPYGDACTGFGKSLVAAHLSEIGLNNGRRVLQTVPTEELCRQNYEEMINHIGGNNRHLVGICSNADKLFQISRPIVIATTSSLVNRAYAAGKFDLAIQDECHLFNLNQKGIYWRTYNQLMKNNPAMRMVGMTGSNARHGYGFIHTPVPENKGKAVFTDCCYESDIGALIAGGFLSPVENISTGLHADMEGVKLKKNADGVMDFDTALMGVRFGEIVEPAVKDMRQKFDKYNIKTALIFASTIENARKVMACWNDPSTMRIIVGDKKVMPKKERLANIEWLKKGEGRRYLINVGVLTTGFDYKALDCVVLFRATQSLNLYRQMVGRVIRAFIDKVCGYLLDYGTNVDRHGPIDCIKVKEKKGEGDAPVRECPECQTLNPIQLPTCKQCGYDFPPPEDTKQGNYAIKSDAPVIGNEVMFKISAVYPEESVDIRHGAKIINLKMYGEGDKLVFTQQLHPEHDNWLKDKTKTLLIQMLKNPMDYFTTLQAMDGGANVKNILIMMEEWEDYFYDFKQITVKLKKYPEMTSYIMA